MEMVKNTELSTRLKALDELVGELTCDVPNAENLKMQMNHLGIEYCDDPNERMSRVLFLIQQIQFDFSQDLPEFQSETKNKIPESRNKKVIKDGIEI